MQLDFSIIIPTYNRPSPLAACLAAVARLDYPRDRFEVIVVDDGGAESLQPVTDRFRDHIDVKEHRQENAGPSRARNRGAHWAKGRILCFTDDDCMPRPDWLRMLATRYSVLSAPAMIGGSVANALPHNRYSTASQMIVDVGYAYLNSDPNDARFFTTSNLAVPAEHFREIGGFDESFGIPASEDRELCGRWRHSGRQMIYAPEAVVDHAHELTWRSFVRQHFGYGRGAVCLQRARVRQGWKQFAPDPQYYRALIGAPFARFRFDKAAGMAALLFGSQAIAMGGMISEWCRQAREPLVCAWDF